MGRYVGFAAVTKAERRQLRREDAIEQAKLMLGFGDIDGGGGRCDHCESTLTRVWDGRTECWDHYDGPLQLELL